MNNLLKEALCNYEIQYPQVEFIRHNENETYKIKDMLLNKEFVIRIHKPGKEISLDIFGNNKLSMNYLKNEISILNSINDNTEIPVQIPVKNKYGEFVTILRDGTPVTLLTWVSGVSIDRIELNNEILFKIGELIGEFHRFSKNCPEINNITRCSYDKMLLKRMSIKIIQGVGLGVLSSEQFKITRDAINEISNYIEELDLQKSSKGIVHCDLAKSNLIINDNGQIVPIDFGLSGNSFYYMDLGSLFAHFNNPVQQHFIIKGYKSVIYEKIEAKYIQAFMVFQIILFISTHIENAHKYNWFNSAINKWCKDFFIPFINKEIFIYNL